jgi:hypothetical protein
MSYQAENTLHATSKALIEGKHANKLMLVTLVAGLLGVGAIYAVTRGEYIPTITAPLIITVGAFLIFTAWRDWEAGIQALLVVLIIEGAVRKWFLPSASEFVYFYKDFLMVVVVVSYHRKKRKLPFLIKHELKLFSIILVSFAIYLVASISNPSLPHPLVGLLGVKAYLLYFPLAFLVPRMFTSKEKLVAFLRWYLIIALSVAALSMMQFADSDPHSTLNRYAWDEQTAAATGMDMQVANFQDSAGSNYVRVTGPFSYLSGLALYLPTMFALLLGLISQRLTQPLPRGLRWIYHVTLAAVATTSFMTGSRGAIVNLSLIALIFYVLASKKDLIPRLRQAVVGAVLVSVSLTVFFPQAFDALYTRAFGGEEQVEEGQGRIEEAFRVPFDEAAYAGAFGYGVGATQNATPILMSKLDLPFMGEQIPIGYEGELGRVMFSIRDSESKSIAVAAVSALVLPLLLGGAVTQHTQNVYQWFLIGIPLAMLNAEKLSKQDTVIADNRLLA